MSEAQPRLHLQKIDPAGGEERARRWAEDNAEAIAEHNRFIEDHGHVWRGVASLVNRPVRRFR